jgi:hypothetical protein
VAQGYAHGGQVQEGLKVIAEALAMVKKNEERWSEAELYRLKGELTLQQSKARQDQSEDPKSQILDPKSQAEAESYFLKAIDIACKQQAKSLELRAVMSLVRLRQQQAVQSESRITHHETQARLDEARTMLSNVYHWFTEGFDTKDLQEAKALLMELPG